MIRNIAILSAGIVIGYFLFRDNAKLLKGVTIEVKPGDKSKHIEDFQKAMERIGNLKFDNYGQYDSDTLATVQYLMKDTVALKDYDKGVIDANFVTDLSKIYRNSLKS